MNGAYFFKENFVEKLLVVGDIHGDFESLKNALAYFDKLSASSKVSIIFLGDYADRGHNGLEVVETLRKISLNNNRIILLRGNHENYTPDGVPTFHPCDLPNEVEMKLQRNWKDFWESQLKQFFDQLYLVAKFKNILFVHAGISSEINNFQDLKNPSPGIIEDILWSDPGDISGSFPNPRGGGKLFGHNISKEVCDKLNINYIIRSHEPRKAYIRPYIEHEGKIITISSTRVYGGKSHMIELDTNNLPTTVTDILNQTVYI